MEQHEVPQCCQSISGFAGLGDKKADVIAENWTPSIKEIRGNVDHHGQLSCLHNGPSSMLSTAQSPHHG
eukprot:m.561398 g.561398  ORF g.561398 m.561398 type:complete len:69 (-) comp22216_c0_seq4:1546-1752(-)